MLGSLIVGKAAVIALLSLAFGMSFANAQRSGLLLAQGGESMRVCVRECVCVYVCLCVKERERERERERLGAIRCS
jgi:hypothetical protein